MNYIEKCMMCGSKELKIEEKETARTIFRKQVCLICGHRHFEQWSKEGMEALVA